MLFRYRLKLLILLTIISSTLPLQNLKAVVERLIPIVVSKIPHDVTAFTQGLAIEGDQLYESTGLYGQSSLRRLDLSTGNAIQKIMLPAEVFGEGLAAFPHLIYQITWREQLAYVYERHSLKLLQTLHYPGEGWGLCRDQDTVWMSNGTEQILQCNLKTFGVQKILTVSWLGHPLSKLNDIECVKNHLYANIWGKNLIVRIDKNTGEVTGVIDTLNFLSPLEKAHLTLNDVLNGIAYYARHDTFFLTGKRWPWIFEVRLTQLK